MIYRFGGFELDAGRRSLRSIENARPVVLTAKLFDVLLHLVEHRGQLVEKQAMLEAVWPNVIVEEANLPQTISMLRRALGEDSHRHEYIATIPGRGYQFVAAVEIVAPKAQTDAEQAFHATSVTAAEATVPGNMAQSWRRAVPLAGGLIVGSLITGVVAWNLWPEHELDRGPPAVTRFAYELRSDQVLRNPGWPVLALSPDGRRFAYNTQQGLFVRSMDELDARLIPGTEESLNNPFFSPDGESVGYWALSGQLKRVALSGGMPVVISEVAGYVMGASWATDGTIFYGRPEGIFRVAVKGGTPELVIPARDGEGIFGPQLLPDGDGVMFSVAPANTVGWEAAQVVVESLSTRERTVLVFGGSDGRYLPTGHVVYARGEELFAVALGGNGLTVSGSAVPLVQGIMRSVGGPFGTANYDVAADGTLVYVSGGAVTVQRTLVWVDRTGREEPIAAPPRAYNYAQLSPDGTRVAVDIRDQEFDIWVWHLEEQTLRRLTFDAGINRAPVWSPDGERLAFSRPGTGGTREIYWQVADGTAPPMQLTEGSKGLVNASDFSSDGTTFLYGTMADPRRDIWAVPVKGPRAASMLLSERSAGQYNPTLSPDGRWLAYESRESGQEEIYVRSFPDVDSGRWQISTGGGTRPDWSRDGGELFYIVPHGVTSTLMAVALEAGTSFRPRRPEALFTRRYPSQGNEGRQIYDVSLDGQRFLMIKDASPDSGAERQKIVIVPNWLEELKRLVPAA